MSKELAKTYDPKGIEERLYQKWMDNGYFHAKVNPDKKPFTIVMPPPNVTGQLHMGHALDETMQDILIRFKRMQGYEALWQPGTDHAAIATEVKVTEKLKKEGIEHLEKAIELTIPKDSTMIRLYKGWWIVVKLAQDTPKQIQALRELYKYDKTNHKLLYDIAWNYSYQLKDNKSAERYLQAFLKTRKANARKEEPVSEKGELVLGLENYYNAAENWLKDLQKEKFFKEGIPLESQKQ